MFLSYKWENVSFNMKLIVAIRETYNSYTYLYESINISKINLILAPLKEGDSSQFIKKSKFYFNFR